MVYINIDVQWKTESVSEEITIAFGRSMAATYVQKCGSVTGVVALCRDWLTEANFIQNVRMSRAASNYTATMTCYIHCPSTDQLHHTHIHVCIHQ